jgi:hypothetical protein
MTFDAKTWQQQRNVTQRFAPWPTATWQWIILYCLFLVYLRMPSLTQKTWVVAHKKLSDTVKEICRCLLWDTTLAFDWKDWEQQNKWSEQTASRSRFKHSTSQIQVKIVLASAKFTVLVQQKCAAHNREGDLLMVTQSKCSELLTILSM